MSLRSFAICCAGGLVDGAVSIVFGVAVGLLLCVPIGVAFGCLAVACDE